MHSAKINYSWYPGGYFNTNDSLKLTFPVRYILFSFIPNVKIIIQFPIFPF